MKIILGRNGYNALIYKGLKKIADQSLALNGPNLDSNFYPQKNIQKLLVKPDGFYPKNAPLETCRVKKTCSVEINHRVRNGQKMNNRNSKLLVALPYGLKLATLIQNGEMK